MSDDPGSAPPTLWWSSLERTFIYHWDLRGVDAEEARRFSTPEYHYWSEIHGEWRELFDLPRDAVRMVPAPGYDGT